MQCMRSMAAITVNKSFVVVTCGAKTLVLSGSKGSLTTLEPPGLKGESADKLEGEEPEKSEAKETPAHIVCADLSCCNKWLVLCSNNKQLSLWTTHNWSLVSNRVLARTASKVKFTPSGRAIVVADKSGDAYLFSVENPNASGDLMFGHLSMLLDILVTNDEKYIVTCDRDEKIRVSRFPNAYNIQSYCLGHTQFVSCIAMLPHCVLILISSSGDGSLRFWDYVNGSQVHLIECSKNLNMPQHSNSENSLLNYPKQGNVSLEVSKDDTGHVEICDLQNTSAVTFFSSCALDKATSLIAACVSRFEGCAIYKVTGEISNITSSFVQVLSLGVEPWDIFLTDTSVLWCLAPKEKEPLHVFKYNSDLCQCESHTKTSDDTVKNAVSLINDSWEFFKSISAPALTPILYKRTIDNVQEYKERKKARLASSPS